MGVESGLNSPASLYRSNDAARDAAIRWNNDQIPRKTQHWRKYFMGENGTPEVSCLTGNQSRSQCVNQTEQKAAEAIEKQYSASQARSALPGAGLLSPGHQ